MGQPPYTLLLHITKREDHSIGIRLGCARILVSNTYGTIGRELQVEATIMGLGHSDGLDLEFWADTHSGKYEELAKIKTKSLSPGEEASSIVKITPKMQFQSIGFMPAAFISIRTFPAAKFSVDVV